MAADVRPPGRDALVLFGSETGTAQELAEEMGRIAQRLHFTTRVLELNEARVDDLLAYDVVLFAVSTTGQGDFPANAAGFSKKLRSVRLQPGALNGVLFASFGLGDSSYPKFNFAHRKLYNRITQLGALPLCDRGESDEQHPEGVDGLFAAWSVKLKQRLLEQFPLPDGKTALPDDAFLQPSWALVVQKADPIDAQEEAKLTKGFANSHDSEDHRNPVVKGFTATLDSNTRLTPEGHWQDVRLFSFSSEKIDYEPGDILTIFPRNFSEDVDHFLKITNWESLADIPLQFSPTDTNASLVNYPPCPILNMDSSKTATLRQLLTNHLDINAVPRRSFFAALAHFTDDEIQKERLVEFTSPEYVDEYYDYATRPRRGIIEVLQEFDTVKLPLKWITSIIPKIRGRQFSIASGGELKHAPGSPSVEEGYTRFELLVAIVKYRTVIKRIRQGLCTRYLAAMRPGTRLTVVLGKGGMKVDLKRPSIMIGPGTGLAPLRSMIYERAQAHKADRTVPQANQLLFFGGRNRHADFFFENEWQTITSECPLQVFTAFSRDQKQKIYVQDEIRQHAKEVFSLLQSGNIYLCGSSGKMPQAVREALIEVVQSEGGTSRAEAEALFVQMEKSGRYQQETW